MANSPLYNADIHQKHLDGCSLRQLQGERKLYERLIATGEDMNEYHTVDIFKMRLRMTKLAILKRTLTGEPNEQR
jgi:hypothetical protein